jgi:phospholipid/cholesterol/gamma-HCH transport system ATP-binding protein
MTEPLIELKSVSKSFGNHKVLDNVDLTIYRGEALGIIGPSGTGKSTILRVIAGLLAPDTGEIYVQGVRRKGLIEDGTESVGIGMVFQQAALFDSLTVEENVGFLLYQNSKLPRSRIRDLVKEKLEMVGLSGISDLYPSELSGGMRKRVSFARAIMANPDNPTEGAEVLLYDEPTAGLDPIASTVIEDLIRRLQCTHGVCSTYVVVTHQDSTIRRTTDRLVYSTENPLIEQFISGSVKGPIQVVG